MERAGRTERKERYDCDDVSAMEYRRQTKCENEECVCEGHTVASHRI